MVNCFQLNNQIDTSIIFFAEKFGHMRFCPLVAQWIDACLNTEPWVWFIQLEGGVTGLLPVPLKKNQ